MIFIENAIITFYKNIWNEHEYKYSVPTVTLFLISTLFKKKSLFWLIITFLYNLRRSYVISP